MTDFRGFLKDTIRLHTDFSQTDQARGRPAPPVEKPFAADARRIDLAKPGEWTIPPADLETAIRNRRSHRAFAPAALSMDELAFLLWATAGIRRQVDPGTALRTVPSAGARHAIETYVAALNVTDLDAGFYRYLPVEHQLLFEFAEDNPREKLAEAALGQGFLGRAAVVFIWTAIPYRMEWRYGPAAYKVIALDAGHVCQNLYLACEAIGAGTCAIGAYHQPLMDRLLRVDGSDEFTIYLAPVGKVAAGG
ncbi:MAG: SagB/ThcOx family dehydrogenase [Pirellulales bacterium]|nr:SagB/ThcOx family dehydrogenase [Pirellulales bacterium]